MIFGVLNRKKIWHQQHVHLVTIPVYCSHLTLGNPKESFFSSIIRTYCWCQIFSVFNAPKIIKIS